MTDIPAIPQHKITANSLCIWSEFLEPLPERDPKFDSIFDMPDNSDCSGQVTRKVSMRIKNIIKAWNTAIQAIEENKKNKFKVIGKKLNFITLTLPAQQEHTDKEIKRKALKPFLQQLNRKHGIERWFWKAEKQENGNIHFHILIDNYLHWREIRDLWNNYMRRLGYISKYKKKWKEKDKAGFQLHKEFGKSMTREQQYKAYLYRINTNYNDPNTTDIHATRKIKNIEAYLVKYVAKNEPEKRVSGKVWDCNQQLKELKNYVNQETQDIRKLIKLMNQDRRFFKFEGDYFTSYAGPVFQLIQEQLPELYRDISDHFMTQLSFKDVSQELIQGVQENSQPPPPAPARPSPAC